MENIKKIEDIVSFCMSHAARGDAESAIECLGHVTQLIPDYRDAHLEKGRLLFKIKKFEQAIIEFEYFYKGRIEYPVNIFAGESFFEGALDGEKIIITNDSGIGDLIQLVRFGVILNLFGAEVIVECNSIFHRLFSNSTWISKCIGPGEIDFEYYVRLPLHNLFTAFDLKYDKIPSYKSYLTASDISRKKFNELRFDERINFGICWRSENENKSAWTTGRSVKLIELLSLFDPEKHHLFVLQKNLSNEEFMILSKNESWITNVSSQFIDLEDTAALIQNLDYVVTTCTMISHLSGSLGVETITLLSTNADWRWFDSGSITPWYPLMRLVRQKIFMDWSSVFDEVRLMIKQFSLLR